MEQTAADSAADREIFTSRVIDAPRERVFGAFRFAVEANEQNLDRLEAILVTTD
jgi:hypothetical protein